MLRPILPDRFDAGTVGMRETLRDALHRLPLGWGPKGRWFKSSRPDKTEQPERNARYSASSSRRPHQSPRLAAGHSHGAHRLIWKSNRSFVGLTWCTVISPRTPL